MSNSGKSHWSKRLETEQGFRRFCVDDTIILNLQTKLPDRQRHTMEDFSGWLGMPWEEGYDERQRCALDVEAAVTKEMIAQISEGSPCVIDTTGSLVHLPETILSSLKNASVCLYLETGPEHLTRMMQQFFDHPKPLMWDMHFLPLPDESPKEALVRCYKNLLTWRHEHYRSLAHIIVPFDRHQSPTYSSTQLVYDVLQHQQFHTPS